MTERTFSKNERGETIAEALIAMLIVSLAVLMLLGAVTTAGEMNRSVRKANEAEVLSEAEESDFTVYIDGEEYTGEVTITAYETEEGIGYYDAVR